MAFPVTKSKSFTIVICVCLDFIYIYVYLFSNPQDTANFLKFIQTLRTKISKDVLITAAVSTAPFNDENQQPSTQLDPEWATALDAFYIMVRFDVFLLTREASQLNNC